MRKNKNKTADDDVPEFKSGEEFDALSAEEKEKVWNYYNRRIPESELRDPTPAEQAALQVHRAKIEQRKARRGRPKIGKGAKVVAVSVEAGLLKQADAYAKRLGLGRTELFTMALRGILPTKG